MMKLFLAMKMVSKKISFLCKFTLKKALSWILIETRILSFYIVSKEESLPVNVLSNNIKNAFEFIETPRMNTSGIEIGNSYSRILPKITPRIKINGQSNDDPQYYLDDEGYLRKVPQKKTRLTLRQYPVL